MLSVLLLHELEGCSRAMFLRRRWRGGQPCTQRRASSTCLGAPHHPRPVSTERRHLVGAGGELLGGPRCPGRRTLGSCASVVMCRCSALPSRALLGDFGQLLTLRGWSLPHCPAAEDRASPSDALCPVRSCCTGLGRLEHHWPLVCTVG